MSKEFGKARYTKIYDHVWDDERIKPLSDDAKLLFMFLSTCKHGNALGAYVLPLPYIEGDLGWDKKRLRKPLDELLTVGLICYDEKTSLVVITGHLKFNPIENENQAKAAAGIAETLPKSEGFSAILKGLDKRYHEPLKKALHKGIPEPVTVTETVTETETETNISPDKPGRKVSKKKFFDCVLLTEEEYKKLEDQYNGQTQAKIKALNDYIMSTGKKYKSHYHTILNWERMNNGKRTAAGTGTITTKHRQEFPNDL